MYPHARCYGAGVWDGQRQADVPGTMTGIQTCRDNCNTANYAYFGFECPRDVGGVLTVHCECGNYDAGITAVGNENCRQFNAAIPTSPCTGGPDGYFMITGNLGTLVLLVRKTTAK